MAHIRFPGFSGPPDGNRHGRYLAFLGQQFGTGIIRGIAQSHPVGIIGPVITGNAFFPIWYHIHGFVGPRELGWSDTLYSFLESDGLVQCNAPTWLIVSISLIQMIIPPGNDFTQTMLDISKLVKIFGWIVPSLRL